ncbi:metal-dependent transcriptional regulator [Haloarcula nitratireducens]|uniref:Metal-dependent transcriptional regulator n=1 Tax=Haloarcula nitratireducens TaxID=2487749 RepID=A0AAW4PL21_9EURY|nr:metal-dependent transcriptional regulator [Halomicroarcula nitratireducens]MBX0297912.1 metal-dependent transcriptional regulator [Halomicroarcula nitratireducens]
MVAPKIEDCLKAIYCLQDGDTPASSSEIAAAIGVKPPTVTTMLQRMDDDDLVHYESYTGACLTDRGEKHALNVLRNHRLLELFLTEELGYEWSAVHEEADVLEHHLSETLVERIEAVLKSPTVDPHGEPIPTADLEIPRCETQQPLAECQEGTIVVLSEVRANSSDVLSYLTKAGISLGTELKVVETAPFGMITCEVNTADKPLSLPADVAAEIYVSRPAESSKKDRRKYNEAK